MGLLFIFLFILSLLCVSKIFSYLKNQEVSNHKTKTYTVNTTKQMVNNQTNSKPIDTSVVDTWMKTSSIDSFENLKRRKFEKEVANLFKENGWKTNLGPGSNDDGKDIVIWKGNRIYLVQCKHWYGNWYVSPKEIREFEGAIVLYKEQYGIPAKGIFITSGKTTSNARRTAQTLGIELWDKRNWRNKIASL